MKRIKVVRKITLIIMLLLIPSIVSARSKTSCDYTLVADLKNLASNVNITYTYRVVNDEVYFDITLTNIQSDMYFIDSKDNKTYYYSDTNSGSITINDYSSGKITYTFYSNNSECLNEKLSTKYVNLPSYNKFYNYQECENITNYVACKKWTQYTGSYEDFKKDIDNYLSKQVKEAEEEVIADETWLNKLVKFYTSYYYIILPLFVGLIVGILYLVKYIKHRRNRFKL